MGVKEMMRSISRSKFDIYRIKSNGCNLIKKSDYGFKQPGHYVAVEEGKDPKEGFVPLTSSIKFPPLRDTTEARPAPLLANDQYRVDGTQVVKGGKLQMFYLKKFQRSLLKFLLKRLQMRVIIIL
jgi:hypothetical protein